MAKQAVISSERLNDRGTWVVTGGIDIEQYRKNPILLWQHNRAFRGTDNEVLPIGTVEDLKFEGNRLIGTPKFDEKDEFAQKIAQKWESGILRMCSPHLQVIETSNDPALVKQGQRYETVTKSKLIEVSIVDIAGNDDALVLAAEGKEFNLPEIPAQNKITKMKTIALKLGLADTAGEGEILQKIGELQLTASQKIELEGEVETLKLAAVSQAVETAIAAKRIAADKKEHFLKLGKTVGVDFLKLTLEAIPAPVPAKGVTLAGLTGTPSTGGDKYAGTWDELDKKGLLLALKTDNPELFAEKRKEKFNI